MRRLIDVILNSYPEFYIIYIVALNPIQSITEFLLQYFFLIIFLIILMNFVQHQSRETALIGMIDIAKGVGKGVLASVVFLTVFVFAPMFIVEGSIAFLFSLSTTISLLFATIMAVITSLYGKGDYDVTKVQASQRRYIGSRFLLIAYILTIPVQFLLTGFIDEIWLRLLIAAGAVFVVVYHLYDEWNRDRIA